MPFRRPESPSFPSLRLFLVHRLHFFFCFFNHSRPPPCSPSLRFDSSWACAFFFREANFSACLRTPCNPLSTALLRTLSMSDFAPEPQNPLCFPSRSRHFCSFLMKSPNPSGLASCSYSPLKAFFFPFTRHSLFSSVISPPTRTPVPFFPRKAFSFTQSPFDSFLLPRLKIQNLQTFAFVFVPPSG